MKKIQIFDPSLCCSTGVCGAEVDNNLVTFASDIDWAKRQNIVIERFSLAQQPLVFVETEIVGEHLRVHGTKSLPITLVGGQIVLSGRYPTRDELTAYANTF